MGKAPPEEFANGRIPFRIRIGVTGHVNLEATEELKGALRRQIARVHNELSTVVDPIGSDETPVRLAVVSQLADGGDRLVVEHVFAFAGNREPPEEVRLEVILPMPHDVYIEEQGFSKDSTHDFKRWIKRASWVHEPVEYPPAAERLSDADRERAKQDAYVAAGRQLVARCDVLIALWNGKESGGLGGTADTLVEAAWRRTPCIWISTADGSVLDNLDLGTEGSLGVDAFYEEVSALASVQGSPDHTLDWTPFEPASSQLRRGLRRLVRPARGAKPGLTEVRQAVSRLIQPRPDEEPALKQLREAFVRLDRFNREAVPRGYADDVGYMLGADASTQAWIAGSFSRADVLAGRHQRTFMRLAWTIAGLVVFAAAALGASVSWHEPDWAAAFEAASLFAAAVAFYVVKEGEYHPRWCSYRLVAERLRSAFFVAPTGQDFRRVATFDAVYIARATEWLQRAFEEVWDRRPDPTPDAQKAVLDWISGQISFHQKRRWWHENRDFLLSWGAIGAIALAIVFAILHAVGVTLHGAVLFMTFLLPAASAAFGVILTVGQHRALARRYEQMHTDLEVARRVVERVGTAWLGSASIDAAKIINDESADWLGAMWFLDVDHL
ncbi:MAG TPA: hypothetical protein VLJ76_01970 [Gaiellaceae bacterium]|nr:hypothetical protein [Gaiellaceae bacterium]